MKAPAGRETRRQRKEREAHAEGSNTKTGQGIARAAAAVTLTPIGINKWIEEEENLDTMLAFSAKSVAYVACRKWCAKNALNSFDGIKFLWSDVERHYPFSQFHAAGSHGDSIKTYSMFTSSTVSDFVQHTKRDLERVQKEFADGVRLYHVAKAYFDHRVNIVKMSVTEDLPAFCRYTAAKNFYEDFSELMDHVVVSASRRERPIKKLVSRAIVNVKRGLPGEFSDDRAPAYCGKRIVKELVANAVANVVAKAREDAKRERVAEQRSMRSNAPNCQGWLPLPPRAREKKTVVVLSGIEASKRETEKAESIERLRVSDANRRAKEAWLAAECTKREEKANIGFAIQHGE